MLSDRGITAGRFAKALALAGGRLTDARGFVEGQGPAWREVAQLMKAPVAAGATSGAGGLARAVGGDLLALSRPISVLGRLGGVKRVPFDTRMIVATSGPTARFASEGVAIRVQKSGYTGGTTMARKRVAGIVIATQELLQSSLPNAESTFTNELAQAVALAEDVAILDPAGDGSGAAPTSLVYGGAKIGSTGSDLTNIDANLSSMINALIAAGSNLLYATFVMSPISATYLSKLRGTGGSPAYPGMGARGGVLLGLPAITTTAIGGHSDSPVSAFISLIDGGRLRVGDENEVDISVSRNATIQMDDAPTNSATTGTGTATVSMFQSNAVAIRVERWVNWESLAGTCVTLTAVQY